MILLFKNNINSLIHSIEIVLILLLSGEESFESNMIGEAAEVVQERISDDELILIKGYNITYRF